MEPQGLEQPPSAWNDEVPRRGRHGWRAKRLTHGRERSAAGSHPETVPPVWTTGGQPDAMDGRPGRLQSRP
ncbi:hypothetical protein A176_002795 [Myxococcus hansupus]|uniref:Uncharacterized protein n=1 Tax=Pseudomyxococcus hansupus TaxID=1297742 RepID=A0A0H4WW83_9BACT|nr:hypothetical protein A176_002795 [Myxococcus hansupus]